MFAQLQRRIRLHPRPALGVLLLVTLCIFAQVCQIYRYSSSEGFFLTLNHLRRDLLDIRDMRCAAIAFRYRPIKTQNTLESFDSFWQKRFNGSKVQEFVSSYRNTCPSLTETLTSNINACPDASSRNCVTRGLANAILIAANDFLVCRQSIPRQRRYHLLGNLWTYGDWSDYFRDFSKSDGICRIVAPSLAESGPLGATNVVSLEVTANGSADFAGSPRHLNLAWSTIPYPVPVSKGVNVVATSLGYPVMFERLSVLLQSLLVPQPKMMSLLGALYTQLHSYDGGFMFVHIRHGDKLISEAPNFPVALYYRALKRICLLFRPGKCSKTIFLMSDDEVAIRKFKAAVGGCFFIADFQTEMEKLGKEDLFGDAEGLLIHPDQFTFDTYSRERRVRHAKEMIVSIMLAAMSDYVVCTYLSNVCRLIALLRGGPLEDAEVLSLDRSYWFNL